MNQLRHPAFIRIKQHIQSCQNFLHLTTCEQMIYNADTILNRDELTILREYMTEQEKKVGLLTQPN
jgi:hypothetical protein